MVRKRISSAENQFVKQAVEAKARKRGTKDFFIAEGPHLVDMAIESSAQIEEIFFTEDYIRTTEGKKIFDRLSDMETMPRFLIEVPSNIFAKISDTETPQGIVAVVVQPLTALFGLTVSSNPLIVVCDGVGDPGNLGTIIRVADAVAADAVVVLPGTCDPFSPKTVRATAGSIFNIPVISSDRSGLIEYMAYGKIDLIATDINGKHSLFACDFRRSIAFAFGNEAKGISRELSDRASDSVRIPLPGKAESLNVAVSAAVCLYEVVRQRTLQINS
ncbi:MAG TPA: RNA methyltransferase [Dissulfurispiraceae bacterium]|nr:RNA methyltransferase [Dissulfurispiraceae bacterium]